MTNKRVMTKEGVSVYKKEKKETNCSVVSFQELLERFRHLSIPEYQRAYRWEVDKVEDLLSDLEEFVVKRKVDEYYMGMILLYDNHGEDRYEIIDGQQRLTTLLLMKYVMEGELKVGEL